MFHEAFFAAACNECNSVNAMISGKHFFCVLIESILLCKIAETFYKVRH